MIIQILGKKSKVLIKDIPEEYSGLFFPDSYNIVLSDKLDEQELPLALYHEIVHGIIHRSGLSQVISPEVEEILCELIATVFVENLDVLCKSEANGKRKKVVVASTPRRGLGKGKK